MLSEKLIRLVNDTGELLGLEETVIEKDYYVTLMTQHQYVTFTI